MARPLRIEFPGALYHLTSRGNARGAIFLSDADRGDFLGILGTVVGDYKWLCYAYCLMDNHYHLVVETPVANLSRGMRQLNGLYTQRFNRRHDRVGHVFQGRFKAIVVEREAHLLELARYVVLNPQRAGLADAERYRWSSLRATLGLDRAPNWLASECVLREFGSPERYWAFVQEGLGAASPWSSLRGSLLGSEDFAERVGSRLGRERTDGEYPRRERLFDRRALEDVFSLPASAGRKERNRRIRQANRECGYSVAEIGRHLGLHYSTVSRILRAG